MAGMSALTNPSKNSGNACATHAAYMGRSMVSMKAMQRQRASQLIWQKSSIFYQRGAVCVTVVVVVEVVAVVVEVVLVEVTSQ